MREGWYGLIGAALGFLLGTVGGFVFVEVKMPPGATAGDGCEGIVENATIAGASTIAGLVLGLMYPGYKRRQRLTRLKEVRRARASSSGSGVWPPRPSRKRNRPPA